MAALAQIWHSSNCLAPALHRAVCSRPRKICTSDALNACATIHLSFLTRSAPDNSFTTSGTFHPPPCTPLPKHKLRLKRVASAAKKQGFASDLSSDTFPQDYNELLAQAQEAVMAAIEDKKTLIEVEFPPSGLESKAGDDDASTELNRNMRYLRAFCSVFENEGVDDRTRVFFTDAGELELAVIGAGINPNAGQWEIAATFPDTRFRLDYLQPDSFLSDASRRMMGYGGTKVKKESAASTVREDDEIFVVLCPNDDSGSEVLQVYDLSQVTAHRPLIIFNGDLDLFRGGFYPKIFQPKMHSLQTEFLPKVEATYYIHNFKGSRPGVLFRKYPGPWQVLRRLPRGELELVHEQETMPSLKQVSMEILSR